MAYFKKIDLEYDEAAKEVIAPTFRQDLFRLADLAEEVARFYGYDNIPTTLPNGEATTGKLSFKLRIEEVARDIAEFCGFSQGMTYSFESPKVFDKLLIPADSKLREDSADHESAGRRLQCHENHILEWNADFSCDQL